MKKSKRRVVAFWGMSLLVLFGYGCPSAQDPAGVQSSQDIRSHLKAAGQTINVPNRPPQPAATVAIMDRWAVPSVAKDFSAKLKPGKLNLRDEGRENKPAADGSDS